MSAKGHECFHTVLGPCAVEDIEHCPSLGIAARHCQVSALLRLMRNSAGFRKGDVKLFLAWVP